MVSFDDARLLIHQSTAAYGGLCATMVILCHLRSPKHLLPSLLQKSVHGASKMAQWKRVLAAKADDLNLIPRANKLDGGN